MERFQLELSPVTRSSGPLNVYLTVDNCMVQEARCTGSLFRGFEQILRGRKLLDAPYLSQRVCGICSLAHGLVASQAIEAAWSWPVSSAARLLREILLGMEMLQNHIRHFYLLCLPDYLKSERLPFQPQNGCDYRFNAVETEKLVDHYSMAIAISRLCHENTGLFAAKAPHAHGVLPGGVSVTPTYPLILKAVSNMEKISDFVREIMAADMLLLQERYNDYYQIGVGSGNFMSMGGYLVLRPGGFPAGVYCDGQRKPLDLAEITVDTNFSWYQSPDGAPDTSKVGAYSWVKAPRYAGKPIEVGPLARAVVAGRMPPESSAMARIEARVTETAMVSQYVTTQLTNLDANATYYGDKVMTAKATAGTGWGEVHRGSLLHRVSSDSEHRITSYEMITPSEWNFSPRSHDGALGPVEQALVGTRIAYLEYPIEAYRVLRSYDPCISCATHLMQASNGSKFVSL